MALLHDIGDTLGSYNHPEIGTAIIRPMVERVFAAPRATMFSQAAVEKEKPAEKGGAATSP